MLLTWPIASVSLYRSLLFAHRLFSVQAAGSERKPQEEKVKFDALVTLTSVALILGDPETAIRKAEDQFKRIREIIKDRETLDECHEQLYNAKFSFLEESKRPDIVDKGLALAKAYVQFCDDDPTRKALASQKLGTEISAEKGKSDF